MRRLIVFMAMLAGSGTAAAAADPPPICADRPGKATSACTVPAGHFQAETGLADWSLQRDAGERDTMLVVGETTFKYGLTDRSDIELDVTPWERATSRSGGGHERAASFGDLNIIYKQQLTAPDAAVNVTLYPYVKLPIAKRPQGNRQWEGGLLVPIGYNIGKSPFSINLTPELDWVANADSGGHHLAMVQVASLGWQATRRLNLSAEIWGQWDWDPAGTTRQTTADGAVAYLVNNSLQVDAGIDIGLNRATPDLDLYVGVAKQF